MRSVGPWLSAMAAQITGASEMFDAARWAGFRIFCTDATTGTRPGAMGTTFRVHYRIHAQTLRPQQHLFTNASGGETLRNFTIAPGDLDLLDRAYCTPPTVEHSVSHGGDLIVRFNRGTLPVLDARRRQPVGVEARALRRKTRELARSREVLGTCEAHRVLRADGDAADQRRVAVAQLGTRPADRVVTSAASGGTIPHPAPTPPRVG